MLIACSAIPNHWGVRGALSMISCSFWKMGLSIGNLIVLSASDPTCQFDRLGLTHL